MYIYLWTPFIIKYLKTLINRCFLFPSCYTTWKWIFMAYVPLSRIDTSNSLDQWNKVLRWMLWISSITMLILSAWGHLRYIFILQNFFALVQFSSVAQSCLTLCDPMNCSTPALPVHHQLPEFTQTHVHRVSDTIQPSHPLSSHSPPTPNHSQHQGLFQWVNSLHEVAKVLEFQLEHHSFQWTSRTDLDRKSVV